MRYKSKEEELLYNIKEVAHSFSVWANIQKRNAGFTYNAKNFFGQPLGWEEDINKAYREYINTFYNEMLVQRE